VSNKELTQKNHVSNNQINYEHAKIKYLGTEPDWIGVLGQRGGRAGEVDGVAYLPGVMRGWLRMVTVMSRRGWGRVSYS
jgi:hypothetical protein